MGKKKVEVFEFTDEEWGVENITPRKKRDKK